MNQAIFSSDKVVSDIFLQLAGESADGIVAAYPFNPYSQNPDFDRFVENYKERFGQDAEVYAIQAYDGANILIDAIKKAGLNRPLIRDKITSIEVYKPEFD